MAGADEWGSVRLRRLREGDAGVVAAYRSLPEVARYQSWEAGYSLGAARELCSGSASAVFGVVGQWVQFGIVEAATGQLVGDCGACPRDAGVMEVGVTLSPAGQGRGLAGAAVQALVDLGLRDARTSKVVARVDVLNERAVRMLKRCGFSVESEYDVAFKGAPGREYALARGRGRGG